MSWPSFDFDGARMLARKRSLTMAEGDSRRRRTSFVSFIERSETSRRRCVVEMDQTKPRKQAISDSVNNVEHHDTLKAQVQVKTEVRAQTQVQVQKETPVKTTKSRSLPVFDLSYHSPTLDNTLLRRVKQHSHHKTPPRQTKPPPIEDQSPDLFPSTSTSPEHSPLVLQKPSNLNRNFFNRTPQRRPHPSCRALKYASSSSPNSPRPTVLPPTTTTQPPYSPLKCIVIDSQEKYFPLPHETRSGCSSPVLSLDVPRVLEPLIEEASPNRKVQKVAIVSVSQQSSSCRDIFASLSGNSQCSSPSPTPCDYNSSSQDLFASSQSTQCSLVMINTPHASQQQSAGSIFGTSPVSSLNEEYGSNPEEIHVEPAEPLPCITPPPPLVEEADSTIRAKSDDICQEDYSQEEPDLLEQSPSLSIIQYDSQSPSQGSSRCSSDRVVILDDCVSPVKTPTRSLFPAAKGSGDSLTTEVNDVWERKGGTTSKSHRLSKLKLSKLAEVLKRRLAMARSDVAMWKCEAADTRQKATLRLKADHPASKPDHSAPKSDHSTPKSDHSALKSDHSTPKSDHSAPLTQWGIQWTWCLQDGTPNSVLIVDSQAIPSNAAQGDCCLDLYQPLAQFQKDDLTCLVLLAPRYYTYHHIIGTEST